MDKSWMKKPRHSKEYVQGINHFLKFASKVKTMDGMISCPCENCVNSTMLAVNTVRDHLVSFGFCNDYECWFFHGEPLTTTTTSCETSTSHVQETLNAQEFLNSQDISNEYGDIPNMMHDLLRGHIMNESGDNNNSSEPPEEVPNVQQSRQGPNQDAQRFYSLLKIVESV